MHKRLLPFVSVATLVALAGTAKAGDRPNNAPNEGNQLYFEPLTESAPVTTPDSEEENQAPWVVPEGVTFEPLTDLSEITSDAMQSTVLVEALGRGSSMWDMVAYDDSGRYVFIPHETRVGAGVTRYDSETDTAEVLFAGDLAGALEGEEQSWANDWGAFDPCTFTPNQTLLLGEEWSGEGRLMEVLNPFAPKDEIQVRELQSIANVSHEGIRFSKDGQTMYYVDEWNSGSLYKFVARDKVDDKWDYTVGQTFVLKVDGFDGDPAANWNDEVNVGKQRTGRARWVALTNRRGVVKAGITDPFRNGATNDPRENDDTRGGRPAADDAGATPYGRPEDMEVGVLANGNEVVYFAATSEKTVYAVEMQGRRRAHVRVAASEDATPKNAGRAPTTAVLNSPDNLAQDGYGNIYIIEDAPNGSDIGGDIWMIRDTNRDGVGESLDQLLSLRVDEAEATGMIFNPNKPTEFVVAVQHPMTADVDVDGPGDALWRFDISALLEPPCANGEFISHYENLGLQTCSEVQAHLDADQDPPWVRRFKRLLRSLGVSESFIELLVNLLLGN